MQHKQRKNYKLKTHATQEQTCQTSKKPPTKDVYKRARVLSLCLMQGKSFDKKLLLEGTIVRRQGRWRRDQSRHDVVGSS
jgi:hypothetical protein